MRIKVKLNSTGETGTVEDTEFNPQIYSKIQNTTLPNIDLGESPTSMATRLAEEDKVRREKVGSVLPAIGSIGGGIVGGIVAGPVGAVVGAGLGGGLGETSKQIEEKEFDAGKIAKEALWGAGGELLGLGAAKVIGKIAKGAKTASTVAKDSKVENWGDDLVKSVIKPKVKASPTMISDIDEIMGLAEKHGLTGVNAKEAATRMDGIYTTAMNNVNSAAKGFKPDSRVIRMSIDEALPEVSDLTKSTTKVISNKLNTRIANATGGDLLKLKYELQKDIQKIYNPAHVPTEEEAVKAVYHNAIDEYLKLNVPGTKDGLEIMSDMHKIAPGVASSMKTAEKGVKVPVPFLGRVGGESAGKITQNITAKTGKFLQNVGRGTASTGNKISSVASAIPNQLIAPSVQSGIQLNRANSQLPSSTDTGLPNISTEKQSVEQTQTKSNYITGYSPEQLYKGYMAASLAGDNKAATKLKSLYTDETAYQKANKGGNKPLSAAASQVQGKANAGLNALDKMEKILNQDPAVLAKTSIPGSPGAREFDAYISSITDALGGLRTGASVSPSQQAFYSKMLPKLFDSKETIKAKIEAVRKELQGYADANIQDITLPSTTDTGLPDIGY